MKSSINVDKACGQRVILSAAAPSRIRYTPAALALVALAPFALSAQSSRDTVSAKAPASVTLPAQLSDQPLALCIVPGSGTAYRVGGAGLPTQCVSASHTLLSLNMTGPQGLQGLTGAKGDTGATGPMGPKGDIGAAGAVGPKGDIGLAGEIGAPGVAGAIGPQGPKGDIGPEGPTGPEGAAGPVGAPGAAGVGTAGPVGPQGPQGLQGIQGVAGAAGGVTDHSLLTNLNADSHSQYLLAGARVANDGFSVSGTRGSGASAPAGAGTRLVWNPRLAAFRAGAVEGLWASWWDESEIGLHSAAFGLNNRASGINSFALGYRSSAEGTESFAIGLEAVASGQASMALGGRASGYGALAVGNMAMASGHVSLALGQQAHASGENATAIGNGHASGVRSVSIGTNNQASGEQSIAIGNDARTDNHKGSVVIGAGYYDSEGSLPHVHSTAENQFVVRAAGGYIFYTEPYMGAGVTLAPGAGSWTTLSDRNKKTGFRDVDGEALLTKLRSVPVSSWSYKTQDVSVRHIGPMAQDWEQAFGLSRDSTTINSGDMAGVTLAGVQALEVRTNMSAQRVHALEERVRELEAQLQELMRVVRATRDEARRN